MEGSESTRQRRRQRSNRVLLTNEYPLEKEESGYVRSRSRSLSSSCSSASSSSGDQPNAVRPSSSREHRHRRHRSNKARAIHQQRRRRRHKKFDTESGDDLSFLCLFLRVAFVMFFVCGATHILFRTIYKRYRHSQSTSESEIVDTSSRMGDINTIDDDTEVNNNNIAKSPPHLLSVRHGATADSTTTVGLPSTTEIRQQPQPHPLVRSTTATAIHTADMQNLSLPGDFDAFDVVQRFESFILGAITAPRSLQQLDETKNNAGSTDDHFLQQQRALFWQTAAGLRTQFADTYGGEEVARVMLARGLTSSHQPQTTKTLDGTTPLLPDELHMTACRLHHAKQQERGDPKFRFAFGGYSVTAGRGNLFRQSFPFVMEQQLHTIFHLFGLELSVTNAAIGGCPSFPYGFCLPNFWGDTSTTSPDVVSWDFSMNEPGGDPVGLEAYLRHVMTTYAHHPPKLIVKDTHLASDRRELLRYYQQHAASHSATARDPVIVHTDPAAQPFLNQPESERPVGFQEWRKFGAPLDAPGQSLHHPAVKEHELVAWLLTMHFLSALEIVAVAEVMPPDEADAFLFQQCRDYDEAVGISGIGQRRALLPAPKHEAARNSTNAWTSLLFGKPLSETTDPLWQISRVQCRTTFEPIVMGSLSEIVVSGSVGEDIDVMLPKSSMSYNAGWVLDYSDEEKKVKRNLSRFGGLGFIDNKKAYYGIVSSGALQLLLPHSGLDATRQPSYPSVGVLANEWFNAVVICEVNEKRSGGICNSASDMQYTIGGINATQISTVDTAGTRYLGKRLCTHIAIPHLARLTSRNRHSVTKAQEDQVGLLVAVTIGNNRINRREAACSISHVVWEET